MGVCLSTSSAIVGSPNKFLNASDGNLKDFRERYVHGKKDPVVLGQGEFGIVHLMHDRLCMEKPVAVKQLQKGLTFRDNVLYTPVKRTALQGEIDILRALRGQNHCLRLLHVYETRRCLYVVTDCCALELIEYVAQLSNDLTIEDIARVAYQLYTAVAHCSSHHVIHRDIKAENVMFESSSPGAPLRLIDFGSGCLDLRKSDKLNKGKIKDEMHWHSTFAGTGFYQSPEMFLRKYTDKTDVWSAAITLYVLACGYPAESLQAAFDMLHLHGNKRDLKALPNMPANMPDEFYEFLSNALTYKQKIRPSAKQLLGTDFFKLYDCKQDETVIATSSTDTVSTCATQSESSSDDKSMVNDKDNDENVAAKPEVTITTLEGSVDRHKSFLEYKIFENSLTSVFASCCSSTLLNQIREEDDILHVVRIASLKAALSTDNGESSMNDKIDVLSKSDRYDNFQCDTSLLKSFWKNGETGCNDFKSKEE